jgi:hypothetical protein
VSQNPLLTYTLPSTTGAPVCVGVLGGVVVADCTACRYTGAAAVPVFSNPEFG